MHHLKDPIESCPYDAIHRIARSRMPFHLLRCRQNFTCSKKQQCPFDARHLINPLEYNYHINACESRESVLHYKLHNEEESKNQHILPIETEPIATTHENWDDEPEVRSYNPEKSTENRAIIRPVTIGLSKSKRRQFRMDERRRIQEVDANNERREKIAGRVTKEAEDEYKPLRRPKKPISDTPNSSVLSLDSSIVSAADEKSTQQKKPMPESQAKANTSVELPVISEQQEAIGGQEANGNEHKPLRRPKICPNDTLNMSALSLNDTTSSTANEKYTLQKKPTFTNASALSSSSKSAQKADTPAVNAVPFSYAAILSRNASKNSDNFDVIVENNENKYTINSSSSSRNGNDSIFDKLSKTVERLDMDDAAHKKKTDHLNREIEKLKTLKKNSDSDTDKKSLKCAANFPVLK